MKPARVTLQQATPFWRDVRVLGVLGQIAFVVFVILAFSTMGSNFAANIGKLGKAQFICRDGSYSVACAFDFMKDQASFEIAETVLPYTVTSSYWHALGMGLLNTLKVAVLAIVFSTILGTLVGIARLSNNWLLSNLVKWYVELIRNTPLLIQIVLIYFAVFLSLPLTSQAIQPLGLPIYLSQRSLNFPALSLTPASASLFGCLSLGAVLSLVIWYLLGRRQTRTGRPLHRLTWCGTLLLIAVVAGWMIASNRTGDQGLLASRSSQVHSFGDIQALVLKRAGVEDVGDLAGLDRATRSDAALRICTLQDTPAEPNLTTQLYAKGLPYRVVVRAKDSAQMMAAYAQGDCDVVAAAQAVLREQEALLPDPASHLLLVVPERPVVWSLPNREGLNIAGGSRISPEFAGLLIALVLYAGAFIAEIVRAGIQSVSTGQKEAATALGLSEGQCLRLIILPQSLRVIIPPLISEYLGTIKDSSLGIAIGFPDLYNVSYTVINQSGRSIQVIGIVMLIYLVMSLATSALLNWYNQRIAFVER